MSSIPQQERAIKEFCKNHGLILQRVYSDTASGRKVKKRDDFIQMFSDVMAAHEDLRPAGLLLWAFSRFSRNYAQFQRYFYTLVDFGVVVHSLTDEAIPEGLAGGVVLSVKAYSNADYSEQLSKAIKRGIADRVREGYNNGGQAPRGYKIIREEQEEYARQWCKAYWYKMGTRSRSCPVGYPGLGASRPGKGIWRDHNSHRRKIYKNKNSWASHFRNKSYLGIGKAGDLEIPDHHTPIITWEIWDAVKKIEKTMPRHGRSGDPTHPQRIKHPSLLSGLSYCIHCGAAMVLHTSSDYRSYQCGKRDRQRGDKDCTQARSINARKADRVILDTVLNRILNPSFVDDLLGEIQNQMVDTDQLDREIGISNNILVTTERSITRLLSLAEEAGEIKEIAVRLKQLRQERDEITTKIIKLEADRETEMPEVTPEALECIFAEWRAEIKKDYWQRKYSCRQKAISTIYK